MKKRIICDTCSAIKLASFQQKLFTSGALSQGDVVLHPAVFAEIRKWKPVKKEKYKEQISELNKANSKQNLRPSKDDFETQEIVVKATRDSLGLSVGRADIEQLVSAVFHDLDLITNDSPFGELAEAFDITVYEAEETVLDAINQMVLTVSEVQSAVNDWEANGEKQASKEIQKKLLKVGITY